MSQRAEVQIVAPMPGKIVRYEVEIGSPVKRGEAVLVLESMKMHNTIPSPTDGIIKAISFKPGDIVRRGDVLAVIG